MRLEQHRMEQSIDVAAEPADVWREVTQVDIASVPHPWYLSLAGIPKPLRAHLIEPRVGGARVAFFENGMRFTQEITAWVPQEHYAFKFKAEAGFRVAYCLDLVNGPFRMVAGAYHMQPSPHGTRLRLVSHYELRGIVGACIRAPIQLGLSAFQNQLLRSLRDNTESLAATGG